jgi:hypothetical protein
MQGCLYFVMIPFCRWAIYQPLFEQEWQCPAKRRAITLDRLLLNSHSFIVTLAVWSWRKSFASFCPRAECQFCSLLHADSNIIHSFKWLDDSELELMWKKCSQPSSGTIPTFACNDWAKPWNISVPSVSALNKIWMGTSQIQVRSVTAKAL